MKKENSNPQTRTKKISTALNKSVDGFTLKQGDLLSASDIPFLITSSDCSIIQANKPFADLFEKEPNEISYEFLKSCVFLDNNKRKIDFENISFISCDRLNNIPTSSDLKLIFNDKEKWLRVISSPLNDEKRNVQLIINIVIESTRDAEIQQSIRETLASISTVIYSTNVSNLEYNFITEAVRTVFGYSPNEISQNKIKLLRSIRPEYFSLFKNFIDQTKQGKEGTIEYRMRDRYGKEHWVRHSGIPIFKGDSVIRIVGVIQDITEEKLVSLKLEHSESRFRTLIDTADDFIFTLDGFGCFGTINVNGANALGYSPEELIGKHFLEFISENGESTVAEAFSKILQSTGITVFEAAILDRFDKGILFEIHAKPVVINNEVVGVLGIGRNISNRKNDEQKIRDLNTKLIEATRIISIERERARNKITVLEELNKLKSEFISNVSHELRTPLASIVGFAETISSDPDLPKDTLKEFSEIILVEGRRLAKLINDLLDFSKLESGEDELHKEDINLIELLNQLLVSFDREIQKKELTVTKEYPQNEKTIKADLERIKKVFSIILSNAIKYTNTGGRISLHVQDFGKEVEVDITDTGIGIPEKDLPNLFQKFAKVHRPGSQATGAGLGLASIKQIIDLHKGFIKVRSEENKGTTFIIRLPK